MSIKYTSVPSKILAESITSAATSFKVNNIEGWDGDDLAAGDFGSEAYGVFRNSTNSQIEVFEWDPSTVASASITITKRGLQFDGDLTTEVTANKLSWTKGDTYVDLGTTTSQMLQYVQEYIDNSIVAGGVPSTTSVLGLVKMSTAPVDPNNPIALGENDTRLPTSAEKAALAGTPGTPASTNKYVTQAKSMTAGATINGATLPVPVYQNKTDNEFYACDANDTAAMKFLGFAISNGTDGASMLVQFTGVVGGFTGLSEGEKYYVQDSVGTISTSIGTYEILVGIAISETELLIQKGRRHSKGYVNTGVGGGSSAIVAGFRPSIIRLYSSYMQGSSSSSGTSSIGIGVWSNGTLDGMSSVKSSDPTSVNSNAVRIYTDAGDLDYFTFTITSVTDTGFTIVWTENNDVAQTPTLFWEAEGEL